MASCWGTEVAATTPSRRHDGRPALLVHGFLGSGSDWSALLPHLAARPLYCPDLPGHGRTPPLAEPGLVACADWLLALLDRHAIDQVHLLGYSLGGRIALSFASRYPERLASLTLEAAHPGLADQALGERQQRLGQDQQWASRFANQPLAEVLAAWYQQPLFAELSGHQRQQLVAARSHNHGPALATMVTACSLASQPDLRPIIAALPCPVHYLHGSDDVKFALLAAQLAASLPSLQCHTIAAAGHNAHRAQPAAMAALLNLVWSQADDPLSASPP